MKDLFIIDLESTCYEDERRSQKFKHEKKPKNFFSEIIEFGIVVLDTKSFTIKEEYQSFVKPILFPKLSDFCIDLTTITQEEVDKAKTLAEVIKEVKQVYQKYDCVFASWGHYDKGQIKNVCERFRVPFPFNDDHISLKHEHGKILMEKMKKKGKREEEYSRFERGVGMGRALKDYKIHLEGTHHRGIDDARNISKIATKMIQDGWTHPSLH